MYDFSIESDNFTFENRANLNSKSKTKTRRFIYTNSDNFRRENRVKSSLPSKSIFALNVQISKGKSSIAVNNCDSSRKSCSSFCTKCSFSCPSLNSNKLCNNNKRKGSKSNKHTLKGNISAAKLFKTSWDSICKTVSKAILPHSTFQKFTNSLMAAKKPEKVEGRKCKSNGENVRQVNKKNLTRSGLTSSTVDQDQGVSLVTDFSDNGERSKDVYRSFLGPTPDETIMAGLQTLIDMCKIRVDGSTSTDDDDDDDDELLTRSSEYWSNKTNKEDFMMNTLLIDTLSESEYLPSKGTTYKQEEKPDKDYHYQNYFKYTQKERMKVVVEDPNYRRLSSTISTTRKPESFVQTVDVLQTVQAVQTDEDDQDNDRYFSLVKESPEPIHVRTNCDQNGTGDIDDYNYKNNLLGTCECQNLLHKHNPESGDISYQMSSSHPSSKGCKDKQLETMSEIYTNTTVQQISSDLKEELVVTKLEKLKSLNFISILHEPNESNFSNIASCIKIFDQDGLNNDKEASNGRFCVEKTAVEPYKPNDINVNRLYPIAEDNDLIQKQTAMDEEPNLLDANLKGIRYKLTGPISTSESIMIGLETILEDEDSLSTSVERKNQFHVSFPKGEIPSKIKLTANMSMDRYPVKHQQNVVALTSVEENETDQLEFKKEMADIEISLTLKSDCLKNCKALDNPSKVYLGDNAFNTSNSKSKNQLDENNNKLKTVLENEHDDLDVCKCKIEKSTPSLCQCYVNKAYFKSDHNLLCSNFADDQNKNDKMEMAKIISIPSRTFATVKRDMGDVSHMDKHNSMVNRNKYYPEGEKTINLKTDESLVEREVRNFDYSTCERSKKVKTIIEDYEFNVSNNCYKHLSKCRPRKTRGLADGDETNDGSGAPFPIHDLCIKCSANTQNPNSKKSSKKFSKISNENISSDSTLGKHIHVATPSSILFEDDQESKKLLVLTEEPTKDFKPSLENDRNRNRGEESNKSVAVKGERGSFHSRKPNKSKDLKVCSCCLESTITEVYKAPKRRKINSNPDEQEGENHCSLDEIQANKEVEFRKTKRNENIFNMKPNTIQSCFNADVYRKGGLIMGFGDKNKSKNPEIDYAFVRISKFEEYTVFEILKSTKVKPLWLHLPSSIEDVFVIKNNKQNQSPYYNDSDVTS